MIYDLKGPWSDVLRKSPVTAGVWYKHWIPRIGGALRPGSLSSFRGFYTILFREHSGLAHATMRGLNHVTDLVLPRRRVVLEAPLGESRGPYGMATTVYGIGLLVAAQALGWPDVRRSTPSSPATHSQPSGLGPILETPYREDFDAQRDLFGERLT
jgi:hypothetical protein